MCRHSSQTRIVRASLALALVVLSVSPAVGIDKPRITRQDELPRHAYEIPGTILDLVYSQEQFMQLAQQIRSDIERDMQVYEIVDKTTLKGFHNLLMMFDMFDGNFDGALAHLRSARDLEDKPATKLMLGVEIESRIAAIRSVGSADATDAMRAAFKREYAARMHGLPWEVVQDGVQAFKGRLELINENLLRGQVQVQFEPALANAGSLSGPMIPAVIKLYWLLNGGLALKDEALEVLQDVVAQNKQHKPNIWPARAVDLSQETDLSPVLIAIWDTGVDTSVFPDRLYTNSAELLDGLDNDGNGFVDDRHGIAYRKDWSRDQVLLYPMGDATRTVGELQAMFKGYFDLQASVESDEAQSARQIISTLEQDEVKSFLEDFGHYALYCHGTHVAGIALAGNPAATVLTARLTADLSPIPAPPTMEIERRCAAAYQEVIEYFKRAGVRVVNMSWVVPRSEIEQELLVNGIGKDAEDRKRMARELFEVGRNTMHDAMREAKDILFVGAAGNDNNDIEFDEFYPPMFDLPNLLIVGAVDQAGDATSFTSYGETVNVYASGFEVDSFVPGGGRMKLSGTSMAAPNVANLAAKLFALNTDLTPEEVVNLIVEGAEPRTEGETVLRIVDPAESVRMLRALDTDRHSTMDQTKAQR